MKKSIFYLLTIAAMAFSCQRISNVEALEDSQDTNVKMITVTCTLPASDPDSKVTLVNDGVKGKTSWVNGDEVFFHGAKVGTGYSYVASAHDVSVDGKTAKFTIPDLSDKYDGGEYYQSSLFVAYPASAVTDFSDGNTWNYLSGFKNTNLLLLAGCNDFTVDENSFYFYPLTGAISFKVDGSSFGGFDKYVFEGNSGETIGWTNHTVSFAALKSTGEIEKRYRYKGSSRPYASSGAKTAITVTPSDPDWDNGTTVNTVYFPGTGEYDKAAANFTGGFTIRFFKGSVEVKRVSTKTAKDVTIGKLLDLGDVTSYLKNPPAHKPASWADAAADLVVSNAANCYIVYHEDVEGYSANAGKAFRIPAVKGKSSTSVGAIDNVSILWETYNGTSDAVTANTVIADVDYDASYVYFKMPAHSVMHTGNALIAAKDVEGTILWSWHIWVPSSVVNPITNTGFSPTAVMDRNLGAIQPAVAAESTVPVEAYGLYYQWGRKDPFFTKDWKRNASTDLTFVNPGTTTTDGSVENPTVWYYHNDGSTSPATNNWNSSEVTTLWDDSGKTIYDPCPEGYKTSPRNTSYAMWNFGENGSPGWSSSSYGWCKYGDGNPSGYGNEIVFPYAGYASSSSLSYGGARAVIWGATYMTLERGYGLYIRHDKVSASTGIYNYNSYYKSYLCSVRCVAE